MAPHSSTLAWKIPWMEEPGRRQSTGSHRVRHDWTTSLSLFTFMHWRRKWQPTPVSLAGEFQGRGSLMGCCLWGRTESDTTKWLTRMASLVAWTVKRLPTMRETRARSLGREDPLEKEMATHSSIHVWKIPWTEELGGLQFMVLQRVGHNWATSLYFHMHKKCRPQTVVFLIGG